MARDSPASPTQLASGGFSAFAVPYTSGVGNTTIGIVLMVVHNSLGQTVEISTATLELPADGNGTAYPVYFGLAPGTYSGTFFVLTPAGIAISMTTTTSFAVGE